MQNISIDQALHLAMQHINARRLTQAQTVLKSILEKVPSQADARHLLGVTYMSQGDYLAAEREIRASIKKNPKFARSHFNLGNTLLAMDQPDKAILSFKKALKVDERFLPAHRRMADAYYVAERFSEAERVYRQLMVKAPQDVGAIVSLADMLDTTGKQSQAIELYRQALEKAPDEGVIYTKLANSLNQIGEHAAAEREIRKALELNPDHASMHIAHAYVLLSQKKIEEALAATQKALDIFPGETTAIAWRLTALDQLGGGDEYERYMDFDTFVQSNWIDVPDGFEDIDAFNEALVQHVENHPKLFEFEHYEVTRFGKEVKDIYSEPMGPVAFLKAEMERQVVKYMASLPDDPDNQFVKTAPKKWRLKSWANILAGPGRQIAHMHGEAWMSGCYYVRLPDVIKAEDNPTHAGYIEFGQINDEFPMLETDRLQFVQPQEGLVVLFPSYLYHSTVPTLSEQPRIAIAFDVVPVA